MCEYFIIFGTLVSKIHIQSPKGKQYINITITKPLFETPDGAFVGILDEILVRDTLDSCLEY